MATCFCKQPCERHKFPVNTKEGWINSTLSKMQKEYGEQVVKYSNNDLSKALDIYRRLVN